MAPAAPFRRRAPGMLVAGAAALAALALVLVLAAFPWGMMRGLAERRLSAAAGHPVTIAAIRRVDRLSFHPVVDLVGIRIAQPAWAGRGDMLRIGRARLRFSLWDVLRGRPATEMLDLADARLAVVRDASGRQNVGDGKGERPPIRHLVVRDALISYRDAKEGRGAVGRLSIEGARGLRFAGRGFVLGRPVTVTARGASLDDVAPAAPWPFEARVEGPAVGVSLKGVMDRPLDIGHFTARATGHADDLNTLDAFIAAGLPGTQPVRLAARLRRDDPDWRIDALTGTIGRSDVAGHGTVRKRAGRTRIDGVLHARRFDFDDLANAEGRRVAAAIAARAGPRLIPNTRIDIGKLAAVDGHLEIAIAKILWPDATPFRSLRGTVDLDRGRLTLSPLVMGMSGGSFGGRVVIDQRRGGPRLDMAMTIHQARLIDVFPGAGVDGRANGRLVLSGDGTTVRRALGGSSGRAVLVAEHGVLPARTASLLGQDLGRGITTGKRKQAELRCLILRVEVARGIARPAPIIIDTTRAHTRAGGFVDLHDERLALSLTGAPKRGSLLRIPGALAVAGTIERPDIRVPASARNLGGVLKMLARAVKGTQGALASDADCAALKAAAMR